MKDRKMPFLGIGAASIVLVLAMVCLAVFAALTLSCQGDHTLSKKNLERTSAFIRHPMRRMNKLERSMRDYGSCIADLRIAFRLPDYKQLRIPE